MYFRCADQRFLPLQGRSSQTELLSFHWVGYLVCLVPFSSLNISSTLG